MSILIVAFVFFFISPESITFAQARSKADCVVLLHGLARTNKSMRKMGAALMDEGFHVANIDYPSRQSRVETLSVQAITSGVEQCAATWAEKIHFVTHSMGGILVRYYLAHHELARLGRVVMLGPPNHGSEVVDAWRNLPGFFLLNGPAGNQLGTDPDAIVQRLGPVSYPVGVIAGTRSINLIMSMWLPDPDDGKVSVQSAKLEGMVDFVDVPVAHPFLPSDRMVISQTLSFLQTGRFDHDRATQKREIADKLRACTQGGELGDC